MKLIVCFKIVRDLDTAIESDWTTADDLSFDIDYTKKMWNYFDESAIETALCIRDILAESEKDCTLTAITVSPGDFEISAFIKNLYALKYSEVVNITTENDIRFESLYAANLISGFIKQNHPDFDAILTGYQASPADNSQFPALLSELLGTPFVDRAMDLCPEDGGFRATAQIDGSIRDFYTHTPSTYAFANARHTYLRPATLREKLSAKEKEATTVSAVPISENDRRTGVSFDRIYRAQADKACVMIDGGSPEEKAGKLYNEYLKGALGL